jgi:hypothetical protein
MTLADEAAITGHDGQVTDGQPARPKRRTFTAAYKARILAAFDALPEGSPGRAVCLCIAALEPDILICRRECIGQARQAHHRI